MPFKFVHLCDLFARLEAIEERDPPFLPTDRRASTRKTIEQWFHNHRRTIDASTTDGVALLSSLFPERRIDRVYNLQEAGLVRHLARCLRLGNSRIKQLHAFRIRGNGDLAACVERVLKQAENPKSTTDVTVEEVDAALHQLGSRCRFSGKEVKSSFSGQAVQDILEPLYFRLQSREAKWLTRLVLKDLTPVVLDEAFVQKCYHFLLPQLLSFQSTFEAAIAVLREPLLRPLSARPADDCQHNLTQYALKCLTPKIGVKVGRPQFDKARSMKHCLNMVNKRWFSLERKYDGEYCQIHIDLTKGEHCLQIFSKGGKDSTQDRKGVHSALRKCLRIGEPDCKFTKNCILEGELLVFSTKDNVILPFHKIRKHVARSGVFLGTEKDSQPHEYEQLMIVFYDLLLLDQSSIMLKPYEERRRLLKTVVQRETGKAEFASREKMNFASPSAARRLVSHFARIISDRQEGLVLKPCDEPYFSIDADGKSGGRFIKLKKDYIQNLGDTADFAVVGASYNANEAKRLGVKNIRWTTFHIGCLENKHEVDRFGARPKFRLIEALNSCITRKDVKTLSEVGHLRAEPLVHERPPSNYDLHLDQTPGSKMDVTFKEPFVFEVLGSGFDKPPNRDFFTLRHPRVLKIHWDRTFKDTVSCDELHDVAEQAITPVDASSQEDADLLRLLRHSKISVEEFPALRFSESGDSVKARENLSSPPTSPELHAAKSPYIIPSRASASHQQDPPCNHRALDQTGPLNIRVPAPRRTKNVQPAPLIRVDTAELLPGESRPISLSQSGPLDSSKQPTIPSGSRTSSAEASAGLAGAASSSASGQKQQLREDRKRKLDSCADSHPLLTPTKRLKPVSSCPRLPNTSTRNTGRDNTRQCISSESRPLAEISDNSPKRPGLRERTTGTPSEKRLGPDGSDHSRAEKPVTTSTMPTRPHVNTLALRSCHSKANSSSLSAYHSALPGLQSRPSIMASWLPRTLSPETGKCFYASISGDITLKERCTFSKAAIFVAPCIAKQRWVVDDLLPAHGATRVHGLQHLRREQLELSPLANAVPESQAYKGMLKIVLLESNRLKESAAVIREVMELGLKEGVDFYDWRVLETFAGAECNGEADSRARMSRKLRHYCGAIRCDGIPKRSVFLTRVAGKLTAALEDSDRAQYREKLWAEILLGGGVVASRTKPVMGPWVPCIELVERSQAARPTFKPVLWGGLQNISS